MFASVAFMTVLSLKELNLVFTGSTKVILSPIATLSITAVTNASHFITFKI